MKLKNIIFILLIVSNILFAQRIKDIAYFKGINSEQLIGYGLVVGLAGTGDSHRSTFTVQSITSMMKRFGITVPETNLRTRNVAAVMVTAKLNNLAKKGAEFDVSVSSMGDAKSLRIPNGGILEKPFLEEGFIPEGLSVMLKNPDFTTSNAIADSINNIFGSQVARSVDGSEIELTIPADNQNNLTAFLSRVESIEVIKDVVAKVVLNERTGTVVAGSNVKISPVSISHGSLNITIKSFPIISQPSAFSNGETQVFNNQVPNVNEDENGNSIYAIEGASNAQEVAAALNSLKVSPRDIIAIFQALKEAGALTAELVIM